MLLKRYVGHLLRAIAAQVESTPEDDDPKRTSATVTLNTSDILILAIRVGKVEGRQAIQLAIESAILLVLLSAAATYFVGPN